MELDTSGEEDNLSETSEQETATSAVAYTNPDLSDSSMHDFSPSKVNVLPPIQSETHMDVGVQTDISLVAGSEISSFRPPTLIKEISPYPPLPVISTVSAPSLLKGELPEESKAVSDAKISVLEDVPSISPNISDNQDDSRAGSDMPPTDDETMSSYSAVSQLEGVGPPTILQYIKETTRVRRTVPPPKPVSDRFPLVDPTVERGNLCPFCHTELLPVPPLSDGSEDEADTPTSPNRSVASPPYNIKDAADKGDISARTDTLSRFSVESPPPVIQPQEEDDEDKLPADGYLYCCEDYYWHLVNKNRMDRRDSFYQEGEVMEVKKIDVSPHAPFGSKAARKLAKDRANERVRERELERVRPLGGAPRAGGGAATLFSYARQMKTINFALSSRKCLEDGWTVTNYRPPLKSPEPVLYDTVEETQTHPLPGLGIPWQQAPAQFNRYYRNGTMFLSLLDDGTGTCYYPSGVPAVVIALEQPGIYCYYILSDNSDGAQQLLGVCSQTGRTTVFHENASISYQSTPLEACLFNKDQVRTKFWKWNSFEPHVHAPPFQPVYFQISPFFSMRCVSLEQQTLVFQYKRYTFKCSIGSRSKKLHVKPLECPQLKEYNQALLDTRAKINDNLRKLNDCVSAAHLSRREVRLEAGLKSPRKSPEHRTPVAAAT